MAKKDVVEVAGAAMWIEQDSSIHLKAATPEGDPVELTSLEARKVAAALEQLAKRLEALDS